MSIFECEIRVKLKDQKDTIQIRFKNGLKIIYAKLKNPPNCSAAKNANKLIMLFHDKPMKLPASRRAIFLFKEPSNGKSAETNRMLKIMRTGNNSTLTPSK